MQVFEQGTTSKVSADISANTAPIVTANSFILQEQVRKHGFVQAEFLN